MKCPRMFYNRCSEWFRCPKCNKYAETIRCPRCSHLMEHPTDLASCEEIILKSKCSNAKINYHVLITLLLLIIGIIICAFGIAAAAEVIPKFIGSIKIDILHSLFQ